MNLHAYIPQDRLRALARGETLPDRTSGSALFADISGFTALTEGLRGALGSRRGAEELTKHLGTVYTALIAEIEKYGGSVVAFAGDGMLCWFDDEYGPAPRRAAACAFAMQDAMGAFAPIHIGKDTVALTLKIAIASGPARRFVVGDSKIQRLDAIAGTTVTRTATAEHHAEKGDVILDEGTVNAVGETLTIKEWREDQESHERLAVVGSSGYPAGAIWQSDLRPNLPASLRPLAANQLMSWMPLAVYEREHYDEGSFLSEFRPCAVLFVRFTGIDYDSDSAGSDLDAFVQQAQRTVEKYEGTVMSLNVGDKGSYVYICFGALSAHEDDVHRAVKTAMELKSGSSVSLQMAITQGILRVGAYGGVTRRVFGALGDDVNLAARLMMAAAPDEILLSGHAHKAVEAQFAFEPRSPLAMKGKSEALPVFALTGERRQRAIRLQEPTYALPMVGRQHELQLINARLELTLQGSRKS